jgi:hypothetical protein
MGEDREIDDYKVQATADEMDRMREELATSFVHLGWRSVAEEIRALPQAGSEERWAARWVGCFMTQTWRLGLAGREFGRASLVVRDQRAKEREAETTAPQDGDKVTYDLRKLAVLCTSFLRIDPKEGTRTIPA